MAESRLTRRSLVAGAPVLAITGCLAAPDERPVEPVTGTPTPTTTTPQTTSAPVVDWVVTENARPGTPWRRPAASMATDKELCGYAQRIVVSPGDRVPLAVRSRLGPWQATVLRIGHYGGVGAREVWRSDPVAPVEQPEPTTDDRLRVRARWTPQVEVPTEGLPPGAYLVVLEAGGRWRYSCFVIRSEDTVGRVVLVAATATYVAYNTWGGYSLYKGPTPADPRAQRVSHDRPQDGNGAPKLLSFEAETMRLAESLGLPVAYLTSEDLERPERLRDAVGIVSLGHDEYWSVPMRDAVTAARDAGTNLAFLGANACYWRIRFEDGDVVCYKVDRDPAKGRESTTLWRKGIRPEPENALTGMLYEAFPAEGQFVVHDTECFLWAGTGLAVGDSYPGIVGTEVDRAYPIEGTPPSLQVLAHSPVVGAPGVHTHSDLTYYSADSGAGVVATGTMRWTWALLGPNARLGITEDGAALVRSVTTNILRGMALPRLGRVHPPQPNLAALGANPSTSTGTGGAIG